MLGISASLFLALGSSSIIYEGICLSSGPGFSSPSLAVASPSSSNLSSSSTASARAVPSCCCSSPFTRCSGTVGSISPKSSYCFCSSCKDGALTESCFTDSYLTFSDFYLFDFYATDLLSILDLVSFLDGLLLFLASLGSAAFLFDFFIQIYKL